MIKLVNAVGAEKILPLTMSFRRVPFEIHLPTQTLAGRDGTVKAGLKILRERQFMLEGGLYKNTRQELDSILSFLMQSPVEVYRQHYHDRCLIAEPLGMAQDWANLDAEVTLRIPMLALDPYWYGLEVTEIVSGTQTIEVDGTAPTPPLVTVSGNVTIFHLQTGAEIVISGASGLVEIDNQDFVIKVAGQENLGIVNDDWLLHGFMLLPGQNLITTNKSIVLTYRPRWY